MRKRLTTQEFIERANKVHNGKYDYSKVEYTNNHTKVCIICPIHGEFWQLPLNHINNKQGCAKCGSIITATSRRLTQEEFITKASLKYDNFYNYSRVEYVNSSTKVCIICPEHGEFWQTPNSHLQGHKCPKCGNSDISKSKIKAHSTFIKQLEKVYGNKYTFDNVKYTSTKEKVNITCPIHGDFAILPSNALSGRNCPKCSKQYMDTPYFISLAKKKHGNRYDYSNVEYIDSKTKICIICPTHGKFLQKPNDHLRSCGCPQCSHSRGEEVISKFLLEKNINFIPQYKLKISLLNEVRVDFYLNLDKEYIIEFNGIQHYERVPYFHKNNDEFYQQVWRDKQLNKWCKNNNITLIVIKYDQIDKIEKILTKKLKLK